MKAMIQLHSVQLTQNSKTDCVTETEKCNF
jgi:hypothetical protein